MTRTPLSLLAAGVLLAAAPAAAAGPPPGGLPDLVGPRALGLSAVIGAASGNDGLFVNPGALAARRRYSVEGLFTVERRGADTATQVWGGSVVDSQTAPVAGGFSFLRATRGDWTGNMYRAAIAGAIAPRMNLGVTGKYLTLAGPAGKKTGIVTVDAGLHWEVSSLISLGAAGYNLAPTGNEAVAPLGFGAGLALGSDRRAQVLLEWKGEKDRIPDRTTNRYAAGLEILLGDMFPLRAGYVIDEALDTQWWSAGVGIVTRSGAAIDAGYRQSIDDVSARWVGVSVKLFVFQ